MVCTHGTHDRQSRFLGGLLLSSSLLLGALLAVSYGQITLDGSLGPQGPLAGPHYPIGADVGQIHGGNLTLTAQGRVRLQDSAITASVGGGADDGRGPPEPCRRRAPSNMQHGATAANRVS